MWPASRAVTLIGVYYSSLRQAEHEFVTQRVSARGTILRKLFGLQGSVRIITHGVVVGNAVLTVIWSGTTRLLAVRGCGVGV